MSHQKWEARCVDLEVRLPSGNRRLHIPSLHDDITGATLRKKQVQRVYVIFYWAVDTYL